VILVGATVSVANGSAAGPQTMRIVGYSPVERRVYLELRHEDASGGPAELYYLALASSNPDSLRRAEWFERAVKASQRSREDWDRLRVFQRGLTPLIPTACRLVQLSLSETSQDSLAMDPLWKIPRSHLRITLGADGRWGDLEVIGFYRTATRLVAIYPVPGDGRYVGIVGWIGLPQEEGQEVQRPILLSFEPMTPHDQ
jgi:hypothetical protein